MPYLRSSSFNPVSYAKQITLCGESLSTKVDGIQLVLGDLGSEHRQTLQPIGSYQNCTVKWEITSDIYFNSMTVGYTEDQITYLRAVTSNGFVYEVGKPGTNQGIELFTSLSPLIGLQGFENAEGHLQGLGFYSYSCYEEAKVEFEKNETIVIVYVETEPETVVETKTIEKSSTGVIVGSVIGAVAFVCCTGGIMVVFVAVVLIALCGVTGTMTVLFGGSGLLSIGVGGSSIGILCCRKKRAKEPSPANNGDITFAQKQEADPNFIFELDEEMKR